MSQRIAVVVLGMHRSGTSALTGTLIRLGLGAPHTLLAPTRTNERGYYESRPLMLFNDRMLRAAGSHWADWGPIDPAWFGSDEARAACHELVGLIEKEFGGAALFAVKDPRMCRLMPLWRAALAELGVDIRVIQTLRDPAEVAASLARRNRFGPAYSSLLWMRYVLDAEAGSRGLRRSRLSYDALLSDWRSCIRRLQTDLALEWPQELAQAGDEIDAFLSRSLRHHQSPSGHPAQVRPAPLARACRLHSWMRRVEPLEEGPKALVRRLDRARSRLDRLGQECAEPMAELFEQWQQARRPRAPSQTAHEVDSLRRRCAELEREASAARVLAQRFQARVDGLQAHNARLRQARARLAAELHSIERSRTWRWSLGLKRALGLAPRQKQDAERLAHAVNALRASGLFDEAWYQAQYPDVARSGLSPIEHYLRFGLSEWRAPGPAYDHEAYLADHPQLLRNAENPVLHWLRSRGVNGV